MSTILALLLGLSLGILAGLFWGRSSGRRLLAKMEDMARELSTLKAERDVMRSKWEDERVHGEQMRRQMNQQMTLQMQTVKAELSAASERILGERAQQLSAVNKEQLDAILNPLRENIRQMRDAVERSDRAQTVSMERLDAAIKENLRRAQEVGDRADKLSQALTSENKSQGNFGELRLKQLLEEMGLEEGLQFEEQVTLRDANGRAVYDDVAA